MSSLFRPVTKELEGFESSIEKMLIKLSKHEFSRYLFGLPVLEMYLDPVFRKNYQAIVSEPMDLRAVFNRLYSPERRYDIDCSCLCRGS